MTTEWVLIDWKAGGELLPIYLDGHQNILCIRLVVSPSSSRALSPFELSDAHEELDSFQTEMPGASAVRRTYRLDGALPEGA